MGGTAKALLDVGGRTILDRLMGTLSGRFAELLVVVKEAGPLAALAEAPGTTWRLARDRHPARSSLTGLHAALDAANYDHVFVTACDTPFLQAALVDALLAHLRPQDDVVLPRKPDGYFEPLCAVYSRRCLPHIAAQLETGDYKIIKFFDKVRVNPLPVEALLAADPDLVSFSNANTPDELRILRQAAALLRPNEEVP
jgi:molybdopterin-guanine dinucleotide biosynthesis protein A